MLFFSCDFIFLVHYIDHQFWRQQKPESSLTWIAAPSIVLNVDFLLWLLQSERVMCVYGSTDMATGNLLV